MQQTQQLGTLKNLERQNMSKTIMVVDDEKRLVSLVESYLVQEGYRVVSANNGKEAFDIFSKGGIDLVVTDVRMPVADGVTLLKKVNESNPGMKVIFVTALSAIQDTEELRNFGAFEVVVKPFSVKELANAIQKALGMEV